MVGLASSLGVAACFDASQTEVRLRDVRDVAVKVHAPTGTATIVGPGADGHAVPLPLHSDIDASVTRAGSGPITLRCSQRIERGGEDTTAIPCSPDHRDIGATVWVPLDPTSTLTWTPSSLAIRYPYLHGRHSTEAFSVDLETPRANVEDALRVVTVPRDGRGLYIGLGIGATMMGVGAIVLNVLTANHTWRRAPSQGPENAGDVALLAGGSTLFMGAGALWLAMGIHGYTGRDKVESVVPP